MKHLLCLFIALAVHATGQEKVNVTLEWSANIEPDLSHYWLYVGEVPGVYGDPIFVIGTTKTIQLAPNMLYFAAVSAVNTSALESIPSAELCFQAYRPGEGRAPSQPTGLQKLGGISVTLERSSDLQSWEPMYTEQVTASLSQFYRVNLVSN